MRVIYTYVHTYIYIYISFFYIFFSLYLWSSVSWYLRFLASRCEVCFSFFSLSLSPYLLRICSSWHFYFHFPITYIHVCVWYIFNVYRRHIAWIFTSSTVDFDFLHHYTHSIFTQFSIRLFKMARSLCLFHKARITSRGSWALRVQSTFSAQS